MKTRADGSQNSTIDYMSNYVYNSNEFENMLTTEGRVMPEIAIILNNCCFYDMRERSCKLRSVGGLSTGLLPLQPYKKIVEPRVRNNILASRYINQKSYELKDHLGNVNSVVSDLKTATLTTGGEPEDFGVTLKTITNYYPFGAPLSGRTVFGNDYRFGFNGMEKDNEATGVDGACLDFGARIYDSRTGRWLSLDPLMMMYPNISPYVFTGCNPVLFVDFDGKDYRVHINHEKKAIIIKLTIYTIEQDKNSATAAANHWCDNNGKYQYRVGSGQDVEYYNISFEISVVVKKSRDDRDNAYQEDNSGEGNSYLVTSKIEDHGLTTEKDMHGGASNILVRPDSEKRKTGAHELGHAFGLGHWLKGLMKDGLTRNDNNTKITKGMISQILMNVGLGYTPTIQGSDRQSEAPSPKAKATKNVKDPKNEPEGFKNGKVVKKKKLHK